MAEIGDDRVRRERPRSRVSRPPWSDRSTVETAPTEPNPADESIRIVRLTDQIDLARDAIRMVHEVFDDDGEVPSADTTTGNLLSIVTVSPRLTGHEPRIDQERTSGVGCPASRARSVTTASGSGRPSRKP